jgi:peroxiredoxin Q/BCP
MRIFGQLGLAVLLLGAGVGVTGAEKKKEGGVKVGDAGPKFEAKDSDGKDWKSADHFGKKPVVVFFFPAAFTGG